MSERMTDEEAIQWARSIAKDTPRAMTDLEFAEHAWRIDNDSHDDGDLGRALADWSRARANEEELQAWCRGVEGKLKVAEEALEHVISMLACQTKRRLAAGHEPCHLCGPARAALITLREGRSDV